MKIIYESEDGGHYTNEEECKWHEECTKSANLIHEWLPSGYRCPEVKEALTYLLECKVINIPTQPFPNYR